MKMSINVFQCDATPPLGTPLCHGGVEPARKIVNPLEVRGVVLNPDAQKPVVLCAIDWVCVSNKSHDHWRRRLSEAAGTTPDRVSVHCLHPHDTPGTDRSIHRLFKELGVDDATFEPSFEDEVVERAATALTSSMRDSRTVTHLSLGKAKVAKFASNRRLIGKDGKVKHVRYSSCQDESVRNWDEGVIDPFTRLVAFWDGGTPIAVMTYYASHPQSFYRQGAVSYDTVGLARGLRDAALPEAAHVHFCGAGGNIGAGKYNDGTPLNRFRLAERLAAGMEKAWENAVRLPIDSMAFNWAVESVSIPLAEALLDESALIEGVTSSDAATARFSARKLAFARLVKAGRTHDLTRLRLGPVDILHAPGELFVEYQLAAQAERPGDMICVAAYGDCGTGYIGTAESYAQGGYECSPRHAKVAPEVENVLMDAIRKLLER